MALPGEDDFVSVRGALVQGDFVLFLLSFHLLSFTFFAHLLLVHNLTFAITV